MVLRGVLIVRLEVPDPPVFKVRLLELRLSLGPVGEQTAESDTVPVKPLRLERLIVTVPVLPWTRLSEATFVLRLKSLTITVTWTECAREPLVAVTVRV